MQLNYGPHCDEAEAAAGEALSHTNSVCVYRAMFFKRLCMGCLEVYVGFYAAM